MVSLCEQRVKSLARLLRCATCPCWRHAARAGSGLMMTVRIRPAIDHWPVSTASDSATDARTTCRGAVRQTPLAMADMPRETSGTAIGHELPFTGPVQSTANKGPYGGLGLTLGGVPALAATPVRVHSSLAKRLHRSSPVECRAVSRCE